MNKTFAAVSALAFVIGTVLVALPFVSVPLHITQAVLVPKSEVIVHRGWLPIAVVAPSTSMAKGADLKAGEHYTISGQRGSGQGHKLLR